VSKQYNIKKCINTLQTTIFDKDLPEIANHNLKKAWKKYGPIGVQEIIDREVICCVFDETNIITYGV